MTKKKKHKGRGWLVGERSYSTKDENEKNKLEERVVVVVDVKKSVCASLLLFLNFLVFLLFSCCVYRSNVCRHTEYYNVMKRRERKEGEKGLKMKGQKSRLYYRRLYDFTVYVECTPDRSQTTHKISPKMNRFVHTAASFFFSMLGLELNTTYQTVLRRSRRENEVCAVPLRIHDYKFIIIPYIQQQQQHTKNYQQSQ